VYISQAGSPPTPLILAYVNILLIAAFLRSLREDVISAVVNFSTFLPGALLAAQSNSHTEIFTRLSAKDDFSGTPLIRFNELVP